MNRDYGVKQQNLTIKKMLWIDLIREIEVHWPEIITQKSNILILVDSLVDILKQQKTYLNLEYWESVYEKAESRKAEKPKSKSFKSEDT